METEKLETKPKRKRLLKRAIIRKKLSGNETRMKIPDSDRLRQHGAIALL